ncbi:MAG: hypothetical protein U1E38_09445 [Rhodospirillales bacterium]
MTANPQILLHRAGGLHDRIVAVDGAEVGAARGQLAHRRGHSLRNVEELEIDEDAVAPLAQRGDQLEVAAGHEQLGPSL